VSTFNLGKAPKQRKKKQEVIALPAVPVTSPRKWSEQQLSIFNWGKQGQGNLVVRARAGTGKTTTILEMINHLPQGRILLAAFNKRIADELQTRVTSPYCDVMTLHSLGFRMVRRRRRADVDFKRGERLALEAMQRVSLPPWREHKYAVAQLASISKEVAPFAKDFTQLIPVGFGFGCFEGLEERYIDVAAQAAWRARELAVETEDGCVDFSDMLFLPLKQPATSGEYDYVLIDEAQDMNAAQLALAQRVAKDDGSLIVVGDDRQAIYGFRGASKGSIDKLKKSYEADELGLTVTYRCPKAVVKLAQEFVPDIECPTTAPEGIVRNLPHTEKLVEEALPGDFILSRLNAPLLTVCLDLIVAGKRAKIEGKDIGKKLNSIIKGFFTDDIPTMLSKLDSWLHKQIQAARDDEDRINAVNDQAAAIQILARACETVEKLTFLIDDLFHDDGVSDTVVTCSTVHKAKGLEADRVFILLDSFRGEDYFLAEGEEANLRYVAVTRAKKELVFVGAMAERSNKEEV